MKQFDYIIVGGGSAGCLLANRLSADPGHSVLLIEAGDKERDLNMKIPAAFSKLFKSKADWNFESEVQSAMDDRPMYQPRGKVLGGSSSINAMIYIRGHKEDYDGWARMGNSGWSYQEVLPYFIRSERNLYHSGPFHGQNGELIVSNLRTVHPAVKAMLLSARRAGYPFNPDFNGSTQEGFGTYQVNQDRGARCSASQAFLPARITGRNNLTIWTKTSARRILMEGKRAKGLEVRRKNELDQVQARKELILSAGAFGSPHLLMLSGIGDPAHLQPLGIPVVQALPGVGKNLQDHLLCGLAVTTDYRQMLDHADRFPYVLPNLMRYIVSRDGPLSSNVAEFGGFLKTDPSLVAPDLQFHGAGCYFIRHGFDNPPSGGGISLGATLIQPESQGEVWLRSSDPDDLPIIDPRYGTAESDLDTLVKGFRIVENILAQPEMKPFIKDWYQPNQPLQTDEEVKAFVRANAETLYHPAGTCKMGQDAMAVVNEQLQVHGIEGLRVVDASIMPTIVRGNTNAPTYMIAEKAAELILQPKKIKTVAMANTELKE